MTTGTAKLQVETHANGMDFESGAETVDTSDGNYILTNTGNTDASSARTPFVNSQAIGGSVTNLFRIYMRADGNATNNYYVVIRDVKRPQNSNSSPDYAEFGINLYSLDGNLVHFTAEKQMDNAAYTSVEAHNLLSLAADDYIEFYIYHNNGSSAGVFQKGFFGFRVGTYN